MTTEAATAGPGRRSSDRAAAGGPIIRLKISSAPTTGSVMLVARATTTRKAISTRPARVPRASASSGITEVSSSGRNSTPTARMLTAAITATGAISFALTPRTSPNSKE